MPNDNIIFFPEHKRKREVRQEQDTKFAEELKKKQTKDFVETLVDEIGFDLLKKFVDAGMRTQNHTFTKDLAIVIDAIRGLAYRDFDMAHPAQLLGEKMVSLKVNKDGNFRTAKITYDMFLEKPKPATNPFSKDVKKELDYLRDGGDMFDPDIDLD
ncbi:MAG: hypothetical protein CMO44_05380 [Verrucomicrobiales bacterium]|nr:hypothetical protein [Verrucomicrobiales bacterium]